MTFLSLIGLAAAASAPVPAEQLPTPISPAGWVSYDDYPAPAIRAGMQGIVWLELVVNEAGAPYDCRILASTGHRELDAWSCQLLMRNGRFEPATDAKGARIAGTFRRAINWRIPDYAPPPRTEMPADATLTVSKLPPTAKPQTTLKVVESATGEVESCAVETSSESSTLDKIACDTLRKARLVDAVTGADGARIRAIRSRKVAFKLQDK
jgi:TonB family protein